MAEGKAVEDLGHGVLVGEAAEHEGGGFEI